MKRIAFTVAVLCCLQLTTFGADKLPNIIFIMADDLGWKELGCYGQKKIKTPNVDKMAAEGIRFTDFYAGSAVCAPSRCNLMTGKHGGHAYIRNNKEVKNPSKEIFGGQFPLAADEVTVAEALKAKGYATGCFGKWGLGAPGSPGDPLKQGFDRFFGYNCQRNAHNLYPKYLIDDDKVKKLDGNTRGLTGKQYAPQLIADEMLKFVKANKDKPFFVYYPTVLPHLALQAPEEEIAQYKGKWPETPYKGRSYLPHPTPRACYAAMISFIDKQVGRLYAQLNELGLDDNTIVFFTSDNGTTYLKPQVDYKFFESVGPLKGLKGSLDEGGIRVPMVVRWPGRIKPGRVTNHPAALYDAFATLAELTGADATPAIDSLSFLPEILGRKQKKHAYLFWDFAGYGGQLVVRKGKWKAIKKRLGKNPDSPLELYNLEADIGQKNNVAAKYPEVAAELEQIMIKARTEPGQKSFRFGKYK